jgi:hypothetical protein
MQGRQVSVCIRLLKLAVELVMLMVLAPRYSCVALDLPANIREDDEVSRVTLQCVSSPSNELMHS